MDTSDRIFYDVPEKELKLMLERVKYWAERVKNNRDANDDLVNMVMKEAQPYYLVSLDVIKMLIIQEFEYRDF
jgi:hypothetical protein